MVAEVVFPYLLMFSMTFESSRPILLAVASDKLIMNRIRDYWARDTYQVAAETAGAGQSIAQGNDSDVE